MENILWVAISKTDKLIRLTSKVWNEKIVLEHTEFSILPEYLSELKKTIEDPEYIVEGWQGENLALR